MIQKCKCGALVTFAPDYRPLDLVDGWESDGWVCGGCDWTFIRDYAAGERDGLAFLNFIREYEDDEYYHELVREHQLEAG